MSEQESAASKEILSRFGETMTNQSGSPTQLDGYAKELKRQMDDKEAFARETDKALNQLLMKPEFETPPFTPWPKIPRLFRRIVITEKIDGTNASVLIDDDGVFRLAGSRKRWITPEKDNYGFAAWCHENRHALERLGPGHHFGEWWGRGIQRGYGMDHRVFSLFNTNRWYDKERPIWKSEKSKCEVPECCSVVPVMYEGDFEKGGDITIDGAINDCLFNLRNFGSVHRRGFGDPEGLVIFHEAAQQTFKVTLEGDEKPKGKK